MSHRDETTVATSTFGQEAIEVGKIALMPIIYNFSLGIILYFRDVDELNFNNRLLESICMGSLFGLIGTILGTIWGVVARWGKAKEQLGWKNLVLPVTIFLGTMSTALIGVLLANKARLAVTWLVSLLLGEGIVMPCLIYKMRPPAKPAMQAQPCTDQLAIT